MCNTKLYNKHSSLGTGAHGRFIIPNPTMATFQKYRQLIQSSSNYCNNIAPKICNFYFARPSTIYDMRSQDSRL